MRLLMRALLMCGAAASLGAQATTTIDPGMTREQVVAKLGEPLSVRSYDGHTYLLYKNGCEKTCGMNDLVVLDSGKVVDAVFRAPGRKYSGTSSSPRMFSQAEARRGTGTGAPLALPSGEAKTKPPVKAETRAVPPPPKPVTAKAAPATTKAANPPAKTPAVTKAPPAAVTKAPATPAPKKTEAKTVTPPPPKANTAPAKKTEPAPPPKKPDAPATKKDSTKKPPAEHES